MKNYKKKPPKNQGYRLVQTNDYALFISSDENELYPLANSLRLVSKILI